jgi:hypothetical protein
MNKAMSLLVESGDNGGYVALMIEAEHSSSGLASWALD